MENLTLGDLVDNSIWRSGTLPLLSEMEWGLEHTQNNSRQKHALVIQGPGFYHHLVAEQNYRCKLGGWVILIIAIVLDVSTYHHTVLFLMLVSDYRVQQWIRFKFFNVHFS